MNTPMTEEHGGGIDSGDFERPLSEDEGGRAMQGRIAARLFGAEHGPVRLGRFEVIEPIGMGGMSVVYRALDPELGRQVALKLLHPGVMPRDAIDRSRLRREAQALARLSHPNVVQLFEVGESDEGLFLAMEYVPGTSLHRWQTSAEHGWRRLVAAYIQAGRGLAAAHAAGLVHRDFKPDNCIIDADGRVRVLDFGLVRGMAIEPRAPTRSELEHDAGPDHGDGGPLGEPGEDESRHPITRRGAILGTPAYMPPEQLQGQPVDARADQFSFCVSLYEALYGTRPYGGQTLDHMLHAYTRGEPRSSPAGRPIPGRLRQALRRGLAVDPQARWPSMQALLEELERIHRPKRTWWVGTILLSITFAAAAGGIWYSTLRRCEGAHEHLEGVWDDARKQQVADAIQATELPYAPGTWERVEQRLDAYAEAWADKHAEVCEATRVRQEQAEAEMSLRMDCLRDHRAAMRAAVEVLAQATAPVVKQAIPLVVGLPRLSRCDDVERLRQRQQRVPPPEDPQVATEVAALREQLMDIEAEHKAGRYGRALERVEPVIGRAEVLEYEPLLAEALLQRGRLRQDDGQYAEAEQDLARAYAMAAQKEHDAVVLDAAMNLAYVVGAKRARHGEGLAWGQMSVPLARRSQEVTKLAASLNLLGLLLEKQGRNEEALPHILQALDLQERGLGADHLDVATSLHILGNVLNKQGRYQEAEGHYRRALGIQERALGEGHPKISVSVHNLGNSLHMQGRDEEAEDALRRALRIRERALGADHPGTANSVTSLGNILRARGKYDEAEHLFRRALGIRERALGVDHPNVGDGLNNLAIVLESRGRYEEAEGYYRQALRIHERSRGTDHLYMASILNKLGNVLIEQGRHEEATRHYERAISVYQETLGEDHPRTAKSMNNLAVVLARQGRHDEAVVHHQRSLRILESALGAEHVDLAHPLLGLAEVELARRDFESARAHAERAVSILGADEAVPDLLAEARFMLARALWSERSQRPRARALAQRALDHFRRSGASHEDRRAEVEQWLAAPPRSPGRRGSRR